jgi:hypothetical protein
MVRQNIMATRTREEGGCSDHGGWEAKKDKEEKDRGKIYF